MSNPHPSLQSLRNFKVFTGLPANSLNELGTHLELQTASKNSVLLERGSRDPKQILLVEGTLELIAGDGARRLISHQDESARIPIARLRPSRYQIVAKTRVQFLQLSKRTLEQLGLDREDNPTSPLDYVVDEGTSNVEEFNQENEMTERIYNDLQSDRLLLPSLPDIAIRVGEAVNHDFADAKRVAKVVGNDPAMSAKLLKAANSALYAGADATRTLPEAVTRIGLAKVHQLVVTFALRELFRCNSAALNSRMAALWEHARHVAAISHVLARQTRHLNPETALLAGLLHEIGAVVVLSYARDVPEMVEHEGYLDATIKRLKGQLGSMVMMKWQLPENLHSVPANAERWEHQHEGRCDYVDVAVLANLHTLHGEKGEISGLPAVEMIPAYGKLGFGQQGGPTSEEVLEQAKEEIRQTLSLLDT